MDGDSPPDCLKDGALLLPGLFQHGIDWVRGTNQDIGKYLPPLGTYLGT